MTGPVCGDLEIPNVRQVPGYVWCDVRGAIHETGAQNVHRHGGKELYDLYQDGELCAEEDHRPLFVVARFDYDEFGDPLVVPPVVLEREVNR